MAGALGGATRRKTPYYSNPATGRAPVGGAGGIGGGGFDPSAFMSQMQNQFKQQTRPPQPPQFGQDPMTMQMNYPQQQQYQPYPGGGGGGGAGGGAMPGGGGSGAQLFKDLTAQHGPGWSYQVPTSASSAAPGGGGGAQAAGGYGSGAFGPAAQSSLEGGATTPYMSPQQRAAALRHMQQNPQMAIGYTGQGAAPAPGGAGAMPGGGGMDPQSAIGMMQGAGAGLMQPGSEYFGRLSEQMRGEIGKQGAAGQRAAALRAAYGGLGGGRGGEVMQTQADIGQAGLEAAGGAGADLALQAPRLGMQAMQSTFQPQLGWGQLGEQAREFGLGQQLTREQMGEQSRQFGAGLGEQGRQFGVSAGLQAQAAAQAAAQQQWFQQQQQWQQQQQQQYELMRIMAGMF